MWIGAPRWSKLDADSMWICKVVPLLTYAEIKTLPVFIFVFFKICPVFLYTGQNSSKNLLIHIITLMNMRRTDAVAESCFASRPAIPNRGGTLLRGCSGGKVTADEHRWWGSRTTSCHKIWIIPSRRFTTLKEKCYFFTLNSSNKFSVEFKWTLWVLLLTQSKTLTLISVV